MRFMTTVSALLLIAFQAAGLVHADPDAELQQAVLHWTNGDSLPGTPVSADGETLVWQTDMFSSPLKMDTSVLKAVTFNNVPRQAKNDQPDTFRVATSTGDVLSGSLSGISEDELTFSSRCFGSFSVRRDAVLTLHRHKAADFVFLGPHGMDGWKAHSRAVNANASTAHGWTALPDGSLTCADGDSSILWPATLPSKCEIEIVLSSTTVPDFILSLGKQENSSLRIEAWGDELVARYGFDFVSLGTIKPDQRSVHFTILADMEEQFLCVYSPDGHLLGRLNADAAQKWAQPQGGFYIEAVNSDLTLRYLRINTWDGSVPRVLIPGESLVRTTSGDVMYGSVVAVDNEAGQLVLITKEEEEAGKRIQVPLAQVVEIVLDPSTPNRLQGAQTRVVLNDGGFVSGRLVSLDGNSVNIQTTYSNAPIACSRERIVRIELPATRIPDKIPDRLFFDGGSLGGHLVVEDAESDPIRWRPVGAANSVALRSLSRARFQRGRESDEFQIDTQLFPDVVFLKSGDVVPCRVEHADEQRVLLTSPLANVRRIEAALIQAVELGAASRAQHTGFDTAERGGSPGRNLPEVTRDKIAWTNQGTFVSRNVLTGNSVKFRIRWQRGTYGNLTVRFFANNTDPRSGTPVVFSLMPAAISVSDQDVAGQRIVFGGPPADGSASTVNAPDRNVIVEVKIRDGKLNVSIQDQAVAAVPLKTDAASRRDLAFHAMITRVSRASSRTASSADEDDKNIAPLEVSEFRVTNVAGTSVAQFISEDTRLKALTIPRFRKESPPTHVVLAPNGDVLRGRLLSITDSEILFESRLEEFRFPRERVAGIVWLPSGKALKEKDSIRTNTALSGSVRLHLDNGYVLTMVPEKLTDGTLIGPSKTLGMCRVPAGTIRDLFIGPSDDAAATVSYVNWIPVDAEEPKWPEGTESDSGDSELVGTVADDFELQTLNGGLFRLSDHKDRIVVLDFWATWCGPCVAALPQYARAADSFSQDDVIFVAVNLEETRERIQGFLDQHNLSPLVAMDRGSLIARRFGVSSIPHSVILGKGNVIRHVTVGLQQDLEHKTQQKIEALLKSDGSN